LNRVGITSCLDTLKSERDALSRDLALDSEERNKIQLDIQVLVRRLNALNESIERRRRVRGDYDQCLSETEAAHLKIAESTKTLLAVALRERDVLQKSAGFK